MNKKIVFTLITILFAILLFAGCMEEPEGVNAAKHGVLPSNSGKQNSENLQKLIDELSVSGGTIYIPAGEYIFAENGRQTIGSHCIKMRSNVSIVGDGQKTVLKPVGQSQYGMDMFYFNDYLDTKEPVYLENCRFANFVIDATETSCSVYTSAGKGFMFNLFRNCHWEGVTILNTVATGFGVDCPIDSSITGCIAIGCGKGATIENGGASGFGIGFGYCDDEYLTITDCYAEGNKKFGFFFEHQGRFNEEMYDTIAVDGFLVSGCTAKDNLYNFGGIVAFGGIYINCESISPICAGFYFEDCSVFYVMDCILCQSKVYDVYTVGSVYDLHLTGNQSDTNLLSFDETPANWVNSGNSWNSEE